MRWPWQKDDEPDPLIEALKEAEREHDSLVRTLIDRLDAREQRGAA